MHQWITYSLAVFVGGFIPGPIMLLAMTAGARRGVTRALPAAMGNVFASVVQVLLSLALVSAIAQSLDRLLTFMMAAGGLYLIYLGIGLYKANPFRFSSDATPYTSRSHWKDFADVFMITLLNPKAIMFFLALFPQVVPKDEYSASLVIAMTAAFAIIALLCFVIYAVFGTGIKWLAAKGGLADVVNTALAAVFVAMGCWALFNTATGG